MGHMTEILNEIFLIFFAAKATGWVFQKLKQPAVIGELVAGILIGPYAFGWLKLPANGFAEVLAELGVIFLLFSVGLDTQIGSLKSVGKTAVMVGVSGIVLPFVLGSGLVYLIGRPTPEALFVGAALVATSVGVTARVLSDVGLLKTTEARVIMGAAVIDDILAMILLVIVSGAVKGSISLTQIGAITVMALGFVIFVATVGTRIARAGAPVIENFETTHEPFVMSVLLCLGLAALAGVIGLAAIIGAFLAGMVVAETTEHWDVEMRFLSLKEFLVPFFFVVMGARTDWRVFLNGDILGLAAGVFLLAVIGKLIGCGWAARRMGFRSASFIAVGMVPRGEVGIIVASLGLASGALPADMYSVVVMMAILTTVTAPPVLERIPIKAVPNSLQ